MFKDFTKYEVYSDGKIWSYKRKKFLKPQTHPNGYQQVKLFDNEGKPKMYYVHRVVWESVTGAPIPEGMQINHRNEIKTDNRFFENLELMTPKQNINYGTGIKRKTKSQSKQVGAYKNGKLVMTFQSVNEAGRQGFCQTSVCACCRNCYMREGNNKYKGFEWRYL